MVPIRPGLRDDGWPTDDIVFHVLVQRELIRVDVEVVPDKTGIQGHPDHLLRADGLRVEGGREENTSDTSA